MTLDDLNAADRPTFTAALGAVFEDAPWVADQAFAARPFATAAALHQAMFDAVQAASPDVRFAFLNGHPELGTGAVMGNHSIAEQGGLGLDRLNEATAATVRTGNAAYRARFGIPFIICVRRHTRASILQTLERRLGNHAATEHAAALQEIFHITRLRLAGLLPGLILPAQGGLSTHILDTARGRPAAGVTVELFALEPEGPEPVASAATDADGRIPGGLIPSGAPLRTGQYELRFHIGGYFARSTLPGAPPGASPGASPGATLATPPQAGPAFLDIVPVRFGLADPDAHYHVPLLVSPWTYTTYRGS